MFLDEIKKSLKIENMEFASPVVTVFGKVGAAIEGHKLNRNEKKEFSLYNLARAGLMNGEEILKKYPFEISGGEAPTCG